MLTFESFPTIIRTSSLLGFSFLAMLVCIPAPLNVAPPFRWGGLSPQTCFTHICSLPTPEFATQSSLNLSFLRWANRGPETGDASPQVILGY